MFSERQQALANHIVAYKGLSNKRCSHWLLQSMMFWGNAALG